MTRKDYINREVVQCFYTPEIMIGNRENGLYKLSHGDFVNFFNGMKVPVNTYYYTYNKDLLILDYNKQEPICHVILNEYVIKTIPVSELTKEEFSRIKQVINTKGSEININSFEELQQFIESNNIKKDNIKEIYRDTKDKLSELVDISEKMRLVDKHSGRVEVAYLIPEELFNKVRLSIINIYNSNARDLKLFIEEIVELDNVKINTLITNILEKEFYNIFSNTQKDHSALFKKARKDAELIYNDFNDKWLQKDLYSKEKTLGCYLECLNEMHWNKIYFKKDVIYAEQIISSFINDNPGVSENYVEWLPFDSIDKQEIEELILEIIENTKNISNNRRSGELS